MKAILMSIRPEYLVKILNHEKTIEVRKSIPLRFKPPFKVVMYCTKNDWQSLVMFKWHDYELVNKETADFYNVNDVLFVGNGKIVGEFICDKVERIQQDHNGYIKNDIELLHGACLTVAEFTSYVDYKLRLDDGVVARNLGFALHISNVVAYDTSKELGEFHKPQSNIDCIKCPRKALLRTNDCGIVNCPKTLYNRRLTHAPQSWCYIENTTAI